MSVDLHCTMCWGAIAFLELEFAQIEAMASAPAPTLLRQHNRHRLAHDEGFDIDFGWHFRGRAELSAPLQPQGAPGPNSLRARFLQLARNLAPLLARVFEQTLRSFCSSRSAASSRRISISSSLRNPAADAC
ncbi:MAG: hypothetical protein R3C16_00665 [Hyphomonadaceae bacterium]